MCYEIVCIDKYDSFINCIVSHIKLKIQQNTVTANMLIHVMNLARSNFFPQYQKKLFKNDWIKQNTFTRIARIISDIRCNHILL